MQLQQAIKLFLKRYRETTRQSYKYPLRDLSIFLHGETPVSEITMLEMSDYEDWLYGKKERGIYTIKTVEKHIKTVKTFFNWLVNIDELAKSPMRAVKTPTVPSRIGRDKAATDKEVETLLRFTVSHPRRHAMIQTLAASGCRAGGIAALLITDLNLDENFFITTEKGNKRNRYSLTTQASAALRVWLVRRPPAPTDHVFVTDKSKPFGNDYIRTELRRICQAIRREWGLPDFRIITPHMFRHRVGHKLFDAKVAPRIVARALNHADVMTTLQHYAPDDYDTAADELNNIGITIEAPHLKQDEDDDDDNIIHFPPAQGD